MQLASGDEAAVIKAKPDAKNMLASSQSFRYAKVSTKPNPALKGVARTTLEAVAVIASTVLSDACREELPEPCCEALFCCCAEPELIEAWPNWMPASPSISRSFGMAFSRAWRTSGCALLNVTVACELLTLNTTCIGPKSGGFNVNDALCWLPPAIQTTFCPNA